MLPSIQSLVESNELRVLTDSVKDYAIFVLDHTGRVMTWNRGAQNIKGYSPAEIIGEHFSRFYTPEDQKAGRPAKLLADAAREGRVEDEGFRVRKDGTRFWADVIISALRTEQGELRGFVKVTRDLTTRRMAEEQLRESEERLRLMIDSVKEYAIFMLTPEGRVSTWNLGAERLKGYTQAEIVGQHFSRFYPPEENALGKAQRELEIAAREGRFEEEGIRVRKDGTRFWANVVLSAVRDHQGRLLGFAKVTRDMTDRRRGEEETAQRARQQAAVAELGLYALQTGDLNALLERAILSARKVLGLEEIAIVNTPSDGDHIQVPIHASDRKADAYGYLTVARRSLTGGDTSFLQAVANVLAAAISRSEMEQQLRSAERANSEERARTEQAQQALRQRDEFISVAAHELRTPLTALHLKLQGLERKMRGSDRKEAAQVTAAVRQTDRLARLIDRLLDVSRISQGRLEMTREEFDLAAMVRQVAEDFREPAEQAQAPLELEVPEALEGCWDRLRLEQVLVNVLSNAVKYGGGQPIQVKLSGDEERVRFEVADRGIGISPEDIGRIFGRFERATSLRHYGGMGLGLYISRHIVEGHGGTISVSSEQGKGSTFVVELPRFETVVRPRAAQVRA
ncbi:MAG TPA: PAS domain-containing sensor histidine kinase [Myxococcales bacterium]|nr:PAS domain-containing sensor histidine kinase [Myxococcales bacterium]